MSRLTLISLITLSFLGIYPRYLQAKAISNQPAIVDQIDVANPQIENRVQRKGNVWMNITNWGMIGNDSYPVGYPDPATGGWAPECEFPGGSEVQYLFMGSLWLGAVIETADTSFIRVSTGNEGWFNQNELFPGEGEEHGIIERSSILNAVNYKGEQIYSPEAVAHQEFISIYSDTLTDPNWVSGDPIDGPHLPLGIEVRQKTMSWQTFGFDDFIIFECTVKKIGENTLKNPYLGLYIDADIGRLDEQPDWHQDDITGFLYEYGGENWNIAYIADNDGRPYMITSGNDFYSPGVAGTYVSQYPDDILYQSYNWWISNGNSDLDFGPSWEDDLSGGWTETYGTPVGDERKYFLMINKELDYDQVVVDDTILIGNNPQNFIDPFTGIFEVHDWKIENLPWAPDLADGYDCRYLISWGPLGENIAPPGQIPETYLYPGDSLKLTFAYVCGDSFHDVNNPQLSSTNIDSSLFVFDDLVYNCDIVQFLFDNNFALALPYPPQSFRVTSAPDDAVWLAWDEYSTMPGTCIDIYRRLVGEEYGDTPINSQPLSGTTYADTDIILGTRYYYKAQSTIDTVYSHFCPEITITAGAPFTPTGLQAECGQNGLIPLNWNPNTEPDLDHYVIYRQDTAGVYQSIGTSSINQYSDFTVTNGVEYTYSVSAVDDDGIESDLSDTVSAIPMGFTDDLLVIINQVTQGGLGRWNMDSLNTYYGQLFYDIGESPNFYNISMCIIPSLEILSPYKLIWVISDNRMINCISTAQLENNNQILTNYLSTGGKLILSGNNLLYNWFRIWSGSWTAISSTPESNIELLGNYFQIDSAYTFYWPSIGPEHEIDSAISVTPNYPSLSVDSVKLAMISSLPPPMAYYYEVGGMIPTEEAEILYTFNAELADSSPLQNSAIGIKYFGENTAAAMFTFPLYGMEPYDSVKALARQILDDMYSYTDVERFMVKDYVPQFFKLKQNYPNPFNARTLIEFEVPYRSEVKIQVFNILGRNVAELADDVFSPGIYRVEFDGGELSSGIYFVSMSAGDFIRTQKMLLVK